MNAYLFFDPRARPLSIAGAILPGAKLKFFLTLTTTPTPVYSDAALSVSLGTTVTADENGQFPPIYLSPLITYRVQMYDANDVLLPDGDVDPLCPMPDFLPGTVMWFHGTAGARDAAYPPAQWQILNGSNGTPDGRDRLVMIAGGAYASGDLGGAVAGGTTGPAGAIGAGVTGSTILDATNMPIHNHRLYAWLGVGSDGEHDGVGFAGAGLSAQRGAQPSGGSFGYGDVNGSATKLVEDSGTGTPVGHTHSIPAVADHTHTYGATLPPFVALWAMMRR
jgi:hypothetical protein